MCRPAPVLDRTPSGQLGAFGLQLQHIDLDAAAQVVGWRPDRR